MAWIAATALVLSAAGDAGAQAADPYAHYTPGSCAAASSRAEHLSWRTRSDTLRVPYGTRVPQDVAREAARRCAARHDVATVNPRDLVWLAEVLLDAGDTTAAARAVARRLAFEATASAEIRSLTLASIVEAYVQSRPAMAEVARGHLARLDALTDSIAVIGRVRGHLAMLQYYQRALEDSAAAREAEAVIALGRRLSAHDRQEFYWAMFNAYDVLMDQAATRGGAAAAHAVSARARADIGKLRYVEERLVRNDSIFARIGRRAAPVVAARWVGGEGAATARPRPSRPMLLVFGHDRAAMPALRRLAATFGGSVDIVLSSSLIGHFRGEGPLTPQVELDSLERYLRDELRTPGVVALETSDVARMADGRMPRKPTPTQRSYAADIGNSVVLVDGNGVIRYVLRYGVDEIRLERLLRLLVA